ncbi:hypothetical protein ABB02_00752 [Clostridiaceae bacterium JG1575]|nr:hypothetical protein ABB02_00752 [Clostridiaceae bacterium JG1575]
MKVAFVGDNCIDDYGAKEGCFPGGNAVNAAVGFRRLGAEATYFGVVGDDEAGTLLKEQLRAEGVGVDFLKTLPGATARTTITLQQGERHFSDYDPGVHRHFQLTPEDREAILSFDLLLCGRWGGVNHELAFFHEKGLPIAYDAATEPLGDSMEALLPSLTLLFFSTEETDDEVLRGLLFTLWVKGPELIVALRGERGSLCFDGAFFHEHLPDPLPALDSLGAGDAFIAGFLFSYLNGSDIPSALALGSALAEECLGHLGAWVPRFNSLAPKEML